MELVGLNPEHHNRFPAAFSGGQRQRIGVARALALEPSSSSATSRCRRSTCRCRRRSSTCCAAAARARLTYLVVSHDLGVIEHIADRVAVMYLGRIVEIGPDELFATPRHPYTRRLLDAVPRSTWRCRRDPDRRSHAGGDRHAGRDRTAGGGPHADAAGVARLRRDRVAVVSLAVIMVMIVLAVAAPLIASVTGHPVNEQYRTPGSPSSDCRSARGPSSGSGPISSDATSRPARLRRAGFDPRRCDIDAGGGRPRNVIGLAAGFLGGWVDRSLSWLIDTTLSLPFLSSPSRWSPSPVPG